MKCTVCTVEVQPGAKVLVVTKGNDGALALRWTCEHFPVNESDTSIVAVLAAGHCATLWFGEYLRRIHDCNGHKARAS